MQPADAVLFTCSAFGPAIDAVRADLSVPVLRPNEAAFAQALELGRRIALIVTFPPSLPALTKELQQMASAAGASVQVTPVLAEGALAALKAGDAAAHDAAVVAACGALGSQDLLLLGQFSLARAAPALRATLSCPVLTTPESAVRDIRARLSGGPDPTGVP
ncbi:aspartate/glutamate racemase family protein [Paracoccus liaowanqingii]|uniref:aspartate/glutamate racemase family protein n=1 Tax=Paracoccus liaowanqingii TaxID=2560053 RepID=UPI00197FBC0E|nr:aspartate/glutamate racemase family protein [Paracoccus liaowanqingii]